MLEMLEFEFMRNAVYAALLASIACGIIGSLVLVNRLVFLAGGMAHAAYGGIGLAFYLNWPVLPCTIGFTLAATAGMSNLVYRNIAHADAVIGALWALGMSFGIILMHMTPGYQADALSHLFGSLTAVPWSDVPLMLMLDALIIGLVLFKYKELTAMAIDREFALSRGIKVGLLHFMLLLLTAISVVMLIRVAGLVLVIALLTIPPFLAMPFVKSLGRMMVLSTILSALFCLLGLAISYHFDLPSGPGIIIVASAFLFASLPLRHLVK